MIASTVASSGAGRRRRSVLVLPATLMAGALAVATPAAQQPSFRSAVDLIAVDVQVVDSKGDPIDMLQAKSFEVSIKGQRRNVVSAEFIRHAWVEPAGSPQDPRVSAVPIAQPTSAGGRTMVLAIDIGSFEVGAERGPLEAAQQFVSRLEPGDFVGLYVYPTGLWIPPTTDRALLRVTLGRLVGQRQPLRSHYNLQPWEIVEITTQWTNPNSFLTAARRPTAVSDPATAQQLDPVLRVQARECPGDPDCPIRIYTEGLSLATQLERQAQESLGGLEALLRGLAGVQGRKSVVVVSAGVLVSDRPDGRPDVGDQARLLGQQAARANTVVYTVHVDANSITPASASRRGSTSSDIGRDRAMYGSWLDQFSDAAGGDRLYVPVGAGGFAFDRVLRESSGYYLLGVEPATEDRDGQPRPLKVRVNLKGVTVRNRQWVLVPLTSGAQLATPGPSSLRTQ